MLCCAVQDALETFSAEGGYGRLLDALEMVSLGSMAEAYATRWGLVAALGTTAGRK